MDGITFQYCSNFVAFVLKKTSDFDEKSIITFLAFLVDSLYHVTNYV